MRDIAVQQKKRDITSISLRKKFVFSLLPLLYIFLFLEIFFNFYTPYEDKIRTGVDVVKPDPDLIWRLEPAKGGQLATNNLGFRDTSYNADADVKILLLGDSISWGDGIEDIKKVFPYLLEQKLNKQDKSKIYEVINSGVPGYFTSQELKYLELYGIKLKPDMVILQFCLGDVIDQYQVLAEYGGNNIYLGIDTRNAIKGIYGLFFKYSRTVENLMRWLQSRSRKLEEYSVKKMASNDLSYELREAWERALNEIEQIHKITLEHNIPFLLIIAPYNFQLENPLNLRQPQDRLIEYAELNDVQYIDLLPLFVENGKKYDASLFNDANHFSEYGHKIAALGMVTPVLDLLHNYEIKKTVPGSKS